MLRMQHADNMTINTEDLLKSIMDSLDRIVYIKPEDIPNIDLYMDQVTTFMESRLKSATRNPEEDKILTKTMINNYAKNDLLPPPVKKKYSKDHVLLLIFIFYYKGILSISDIQELLKPITDRFFDAPQDSSYNLEKIYGTILELEKAQTDALKEDILNKFQISEKTFTDAPDDTQRFLQIFSFISMLSFDVYVKRLLIEKIIDLFHIPEGKEKKSRSERENNKNKEDN